jgi:hypothetical protein
MSEPAKLAPDPAGGIAGGPVAQGARQPSGALSGVTVFVSGGHGWTAGNSAWFLQRPVALSMCEDYGNIDQMNYFVAYAWNAGATVVPFRPVGWQPIEVVLDNDDPGVTFTGAWSNGVSSKYYENGATNSGIVYRTTSSAPTETATARYAATIPETGYYPVYCFTIAGANRTRQTYRVAHAGGLTETTLDHRLVGNGWVWLGTYYFDAGGPAYVEITNQSPESGAIIADAIRWGGGQGDVARPGPGAASGYPRDEEGQRYWAHSELGNNAAGFDSTIWDLAGSDDQSDNVGAAGRFAREMNQEPAGGVQVDRWRRVHLEFHTNAFDGNARGQLCLITDLGATTYQTQLATILSNEVDADMTLLNGQFEHNWIDRGAATLTGSYGAIATSANGNEFDATICELAFHDNQTDAELLRDPRVRSAMARACVHGLIRFLNTLPGSQVPLAFAPATPEDVAAVDAGGGDVLLTWQPPLSNGALGDPATGYVIYQSADGYAFGAPLVLGDVTSVTIGGVQPGETRYFRIAATNAGGESQPSEVLAVRRPTSGAIGDVLLVNAFDRLDRRTTPTQTFAQPPNYAGLTIQRQRWREANAFDYVIEHGAALAAFDAGFSSCANEAVANQRVALTDYDAVVWIAGNESTFDRVFSTTEQTRVNAYLATGNGLFVSGADVGYTLINQGQGSSFAQNTLHINFVNDNAGTFNVSGAAGSILADVGGFDFDPASGAAYRVLAPDVLGANGANARACLNYVGGLGGVAGVQQRGAANVVTFGFPFEAISDPAARAAVMQRVIEFLRSAVGPIPFDYDQDGDVDWADFGVFRFCFREPGFVYAPGNLCRAEDADGDADVDLVDFSAFQRAFTGPGGPP